MTNTGLGIHVCLLATTRARDPVCLTRLLDSLARQTYRDFSLLLGDQNPHGLLDPLLTAYTGRFPLRVIALPPCSLSEARNRLLPFVKGEYVALTDDDCHYPPDCLAQLVRYARRLPLAGGFIGRMGGGGESTTFLPPEPLTRFSVFRNAPSWCVFLRHTALAATGRFDPDMGIGAATPWQSGEETDFLLRMLDRGEKLYRAPSIRVFHPDPPTDTTARAKIHAYGMGRMYLLRKHRLPLWFKVANVVYPLLAMLRELPQKGVANLHCRLAMFRGRLKGFCLCLTHRI